MSPGATGTSQPWSTSAIPALAETIDLPDAGLRAALLGAMLMGVASQRYLLRMPDLCEVDTDEILRLIAPLLRALIHPGDD